MRSLCRNLRRPEAIFLAALGLSAKKRIAPGAAAMSKMPTKLAA